jgi:hypothetical protein
MLKHRVTTVLSALLIVSAASLMTTPAARASDSLSHVSAGVASSSGWFSFFRGRNSKSHYTTSSKKAPPSMSNGSFYEKWRADRKVTGRAHRP